jgi:hypothetical protein
MLETGDAIQTKVTNMSIKRRIFYSFHFNNDAWRAGQVRNIGVVEGNEPVSPNDWEAVKRNGDAAIERWIEAQMQGRTCTVVLVGAETALRPWVRHEIVKSWARGMGVLGIRVHKLLNQARQSSGAGPNPFDHLQFDDGTLASTKIRLYDPTGYDSQQTYASISANVGNWIEAAVAARR